MNLLGVVLVILILLAVGSLPTWPHSHAWGYAPSGSAGLLLVILVLFLLLRRR